MQELNSKLSLLRTKVLTGQPVTVMIIGLGSVGLYLLDYLIGLNDPQLRIVVAGRNRDKMQSDINIVKTAAAIRGCMRSSVVIDDRCDLERVESISEVLLRHTPDMIVNCSRVYSGLKYGSISWNKLRSYGIWTPLSIRYIRNIMEAYALGGNAAIIINTSYSDAVIPWLKSAGKAHPDFGSGNLNHLIPRMKFYISREFGIENLNEIDITLAASHFHDVVISKEGHAEGQDILLDIHYAGQKLQFDTKELLKACKIFMPTDQKRNMMNASSNFNIIESILGAIRLRQCRKIHSPGAFGEIGGYPCLIDATSDTISSDFYTGCFSMDQMRKANRASIYLDGVENVDDGILFYTDELLAKVKIVFGIDLPKMVHFDEIDDVGQLIIDRIIHSKIV